MILDWLFIVIGLLVLVAGAEALVRGASGIALLVRMTPAVVALTVVAAGTSMPELVVSVRAAVAGNPGLALGNAIGSNFLNIGLVLGLTALVSPLLIKKNTIKFQWPAMMIATLLFYFLARTGEIDRLEGGFMTAALVAFMAYAVFLDRRKVVEVSVDDELQTADFGRKGTTAALLNILAVVIGIALLAVGADTMVKGAIGVAAGLGVSDTIIGLTVVAVGTSAPELVTSLVAALRGRSDMAVGNIIGSCIFNLLGILGITAIISPLPVAPELINRDMIWLLGITVLLLPMMWTGRKLNRIEGALLFLGFVAYMTVLILAT